MTLAPTRPSFATTTAVTLAPTVATVPPPPKPIADLSVSGSLLGPLVNGHNVYLSAVVANAGPGVADGVAVTMVLPAPLVFEAPAAPAWTCTAAGQSPVTCTLAGTLISGAKSTLLVQASVTPLTVVRSAQSESVAARVITAAAAVSSSVTMVVSSNATDPSLTSNDATVALPTPTDGGMSALYATVDHGNITMTGASLMTCDVKAPDCVTALADKPDASAGGTLDNGSFTMTAIDTDGEAGTTASSSATLAIPEGATVKQAYLVWGATAFATGDELTAADFVNAQLTWLDKIGSSQKTTEVVAKDVSTTLSDAKTVDGVYARADVTTLIRDGGPGTYTFGSSGYNGSGMNRAGGWALIVVYTKTSEPLRSLVVLDGLVGYGSNANKTLTMSLGGLGPVATSTAVPVSFGVVGFDGDRGLDDTMTIGSAAPHLVPVADSNNRARDVMNSTVSIRGSLQGDPNTMGFDADLVDLTVIGGGNLELTATGTGDQIRLGLITLSAPAS